MLVRSVTFLLVLAAAIHVSTQQDDDELSSTEQDIAMQMAEAVKDLANENIGTVEERLKNILTVYGQTLAWQQQTVMDRVRMQGDSGLQQTRNLFSGTKAWWQNNWSRVNGQAAIHNHANNIRTVGMGEISVVMNGVNFRTRHNDYRLNMASRDSTEYSAIDPIDFPDVPPSVLEKATVPEQVAEMKEYFKAFADQNPNHRDYKPYFKPLLTYMQGMWTVPESTIDEPFFSDRHKINADTWYQLQEDVNFATWTGKKDIGENLAVLPTMIYGINEDGSPKVAQWNYKILAHPLTTEVPLNRFRVVDDLSLMMRSFRSTAEFAKTRSARFQLHPTPSADEYDGIWREEMSHGWYNYLEELMKEVPGLDNYPADIGDSNFDEPDLIDVDGESVLNAGYYHRYYSLAEDDASGFSRAARGFADQNLFVALNNQSKIAPIKTRKCTGRGRWQVCEFEHLRVSYAIPLEIVYLTPLNAWNPYDLYHDSVNQHNPRGHPDLGDWYRTGGSDNADRALNGTSDIYYYRTPAEMFEGGELGTDSADTTMDAVYVLDQGGEVRRTVASGIRVFFPNIPDVGSVRQRYPIFNVHDEGSSIFKELAAVKDLVRNGATYAHLYERPLGGFSVNGTSGLERFTFALRKSSQTPFGGPHVHTFEISANQIMAMREGVGNPGYLVQVSTSEMSRHSHSLQIRMRSGRDGVWIYSCDGNPFVCGDGHPANIDCIDCPLNLLKFNN